MMPSAFVVLDELPLTNNGKINRKALPAPEYSNPDKATHVAPRTQTEKILAEIWSEVLELDQVSVKDNFFESLATLFQSSTVEQLASVLEEELERQG